MIILIIEFIIFLIVLLWLNFHIKEIQLKLDTIIDMLKERNNKK